jgi:hypothetical protein
MSVYAKAETIPIAIDNMAKKAGEKRGAQEQLRTAVSMFREMGMESWLKKAESALTSRWTRPSA